MTGLSRGATGTLLGVFSLFGVAAGLGQSERPPDERSRQRSDVQVNREVHHDTSPPLWSISPAPRSGIREYEAPRPVPRPRSNPRQIDRALQAQAAEVLAPSVLLGFDGVGNGFVGPSGTFTVNSAPPDTNGDVGPNHYVETVNTDFAVFDKTGTVLYGPVPINTLWSGFGGGCQSHNDGDPIVLYDPIADRWLISQFSVATTPYLQCVAISQTGDPTGAYNRYSFQYSDFPDYPKFGVWPDAYYVTFNMFTGGTTFAGAKVCAYDRTKMLAGQPATQQCFDARDGTPSSPVGGLIPADLDGARLPPAGTPNYVVGLGNNANQLVFYKFHVDFATPANSSLTGPTDLAVAAFSEACAGGTCIPQTGTTQQLDSVADRVMHRLAYRNFGDHESLVVNHSIVAGSSVGVRWYELRLSGGTASIFQQGTYAPDTNYRWMGSIAQDQAGNMALGFSLSGSALHPEMHYTGRLAGDAAGQMTQGEGTFFAGAGSQTGSLSRWGDYSMMAVDPVDDCTFWYTNEYIPMNGSFNWATRIGTFKFPDCGTPPASDFSISANPSSASVTQGNSTTSTISTAVTSGTAQTVALSVSGAPAGVTTSLSPTSVTAGGSSTPTVNVDATTTPGTYTLTITGTGSSATHSASFSLTVTAPPPNDFSIAVSPSSASAGQGGSATATITTAVTSGSAQTVALSVSGAPVGTSASASPSSVTGAGTSTLTVNVGASTMPGTYTLTITGTGSSATHSASFTLTVLAPPPPSDFSIAVSPASASAAQGGSAAASITTAVTSGSAQTVALSVSGAPTGTTASATPSSVTAGGNSTLTVNVGAATTPGTYTLTITGTGTSATHTASFSLTVTGTGIVNGGFESGLTGWTSAGMTGISTGAHSGAQAARVGSASAFNGDSSVSQTFTVPAAGGTLSLWYKVVCTDTVTYDWATVTLRDNTTGVLSTPLPKTCTNNNTWRQLTATLSAGHSMSLTLIDHDDNYASDPTYTLYDDVAIAAPVANPILNGGFEAGLTSWTSSGTTATSTIAHSGTASARAGSTSPTLNSSLVQTFTVPTAGGTLSFWYRMTCPDTVTYDWATVTLRDNTSGVTRTLLPRTCTNTGLWVQVSASVASSAGHSVTLTMANHDDNYSGDPSFTLYDDVVIQ